MKPYAKPKIRKPKREGWTQREAMVALVSVVVAAVGAVASAGSALFTYDQVRMLNRERMTPYRAILFEKKLKSYQSLVVADSSYLGKENIAQFIYSMSIDNDTAIRWLQEPTASQFVNTHRKAQSKSKPLPVYKSRLSSSGFSASIDDLLSEAGQLRVTYTQNQLLWSPEISAHLTATLTQAGEIEKCFDEIKQLHIEIPECETSKVAKLSVKLQEAMTLAEHSMRDDLHANQTVLQVIAPD